MSKTKKSDIVLLSKERLEEVEQKVKQKRGRTKDEWRSIFVLIILIGFFLIIAGIVIRCIVDDKYDMIQLLSTVGSIVGAPLGFVIGYYYKSKT